MNYVQTNYFVSGTIKCMYVIIYCIQYVAFQENEHRQKKKKKKITNQ